MKYFSGEQFRKAFYALPKVAQDAVYADDTREKMESVYLACNIPTEKQEALSYLFDTALYGLVPWEEVEGEVRAILSCTESVAKDLTERMDKVLFVDLHDILRKAHELFPEEVKRPSPTPLTSTNVSNEEKEEKTLPLPESPFTPFLEKGAPAERFKKLPPSVREAILSEDLGKAFTTLLAPRALSEEQKVFFTQHVFAVLAGETAVRTFKENVARDLTLPAPVLDALFSETEEKVFRPVRMAILAVLEHREESV